MNPGRARRVPSRAFRLQRDEPVGKGIARMAHGRIAHALEELGGTTDSTPEEAVHEARKDVKKLRALLRLVRSTTNARVRTRENEALRDIARALSGVRDADVMLATLAGLEDLAPDVAAPLRAQLEEHRSAVAVASTDATALELTRVRDRVRTWTPPGDDFVVVRAGLERGYWRGQRALRAARREPSAEHLHDWRKRVKDHWYNLTVLREVWPPVMEPLAEAAHQLSERPGGRTTTSRCCSISPGRRPDGPDGADRLAVLAGVIESRREGLRPEAFVLGRRLYAERPRAFADRVESLWLIWRSLAPA